MSFITSVRGSTIYILLAQIPHFPTATRISSERGGGIPLFGKTAPAFLLLSNTFPRTFGSTLRLTHMLWDTGDYSIRRSHTFWVLAQHLRLQRCRHEVCRLSVKQGYCVSSPRGTLSSAPILQINMNVRQLTEKPSENCSRSYSIFFAMLSPLSSSQHKHKFWLKSSF